MSDVQRICPQCGESSAMGLQHCPHCGFNVEAGMPMRQTSALPATITRAALPVLAGAASLALSAGWKLLQSRLAETAARNAVTQVVKAPPAETRPAPTNGAKRTIRIRSTWAVGDAHGNWRQGASEHIIEFDD